jgi:hypothetical protein
MMAFMRSGRNVALCASLAAVGIGCGPSESRTGTIGGTGEGFFQYSCVTDGDAVCNQTGAVDANSVVELGINQEVPEAVAVGARFDLHFSGTVLEDDGETLLVETVPASFDHVETSGGFVIDEAGFWAFLAQSPKGVVADFIHVQALEAADLEVWKDEQKVTAFEMTVGSELQVAAVPRDEAGLALGGALPYLWTSSDPGVALVDQAGGTGVPTGGIEINDDEVRIYAAAAGTTNIEVQRGELVHTVAVTVTEVMP